MESTATHHSSGSKRRIRDARLERARYWQAKREESERAERVLAELDRKALTRQLNNWIRRYDAARIEGVQ